MKLALAPIAYYWPADKVQSFYRDIAASPIDRVYLGEVVCARRHHLRIDDWLTLARQLRDAGKEVCLSTQTLIESETERRIMLRMIEGAQKLGLTVEANDLSAVSLVRGTPFVAGPHLNVYNAGTLDWLARLGATRFVPPVEMEFPELAALIAARPAGMQTEVAVWGRMALAFSARCFTARHHHLQKDDCQFRCEQDPDGMLLKTQEQVPFLNLNGIQVQSSTCLDLSPQLPALRQLGIDAIRIQPQAEDTPRVIEAFAALRDGKPAALPDQLLPPGAARSNGYFHGKPGLAWLNDTAASEEENCHA